SGDMSAMFSINSLKSEIIEGQVATFGPFNLLLGGRGGGGGGSFGQGSSMLAVYENEELGYVRAGDFSVDLMSPLMGQNMSGRGGEVLYRNGDTDYRAFYARGRGSIPSEIMGLQVAQYIGEDGTVRLTVSRDSERSVPEGYERAAESSTNLGLFAGYRLSEGTEVTGEIARSSVSEAGSDIAWRLNARYKMERFSANCEWLRAGVDFRGGWSDTELRRLSLSWSVLDNLNIWANYNQTQNNLSGDPEEEGRRNRNTAFGATWSIEGFGQFRVSHRIDLTRDIVLQDTDTAGRTTEYSLSRDWGGFRISASWQDQTDEDRITGDRQTDRTLRLDCDARLNDNISAQMGYSMGRTSGNDEGGASRTNSISLGGDISLGSDMDFSFSAQKDSGGLQGSRTSANGTLRWEMSSGSTMNLYVRSYTGDTEVALSYTYPLSIPLTMFPRKGSMAGRVFLADDPTQGISNVRVSVGQIEMVTDEGGAFSFPSLDPGEHQLTVDTTSLGVGMTSEAELPLIFTVEAGSSVQLEIPVMRSVAIGGQVFIQTPGSGGAAPSREPLSEMVVELQAGPSSFYRFTDSYGRFLFADLVPGSYVVLLRSDYLPQWHEVLDPASYELDLAPGESRRDLEFTVALTQREVDITVESTTE
ncbi:MAG: hypothetical protein NTY09_05945, partial [bacterium]|nr:hypothetical protein [bacterium]